jgi:HAD superfamily hydrolase (TIGR01450 family)
MTPPEEVTMTRSLGLNAIELFLFDVDGVFLEGKRDPRLVSGSRILPRLWERGTPFRLVTNTSTHPREFLAEALTGHGIDVRPREIHAALEVTVGVAARRFPGGRCHVVGEPGMRAAAVDAGLVPVDDAPADVVLVGLTRFADYELLSAAARCLKGGAQLLACHRNRMWIDEKGASLSCGPWLAALEYATGVEAEWFGKPSEAFYEEACRELGVPASAILMIGDDLESDVVGAQRAGMAGGLVLSGKTSRRDLARSDVTPDLILDQIDDLADRLD